MVQGTWSDVFEWPLVGIHAILTPDGKVLTYGTDLTGQQGGQMFMDVWDPMANTHYTLQHHMQTDLFCSSGVIVPETGEILIAGGDSRGTGGAVNMGVSDVNIFDFRTLTMSSSETGDMAYARWYGTPVTLANGKILELGGVDEQSLGVGLPEVYNPGVGWKTLGGAQSEIVANDWWYPRAWLASDGKVVLLQTADVLKMDPSGQGAVQRVATTPFVQNDSLSSIMFEQDKVLSLDYFGRAWVMDISGATPTFQRTMDLGGTREWSNMTLLADGSVMVSGGSGTYNELIDVHNEVAIWNPNTGQWTFDAEAAIPRLYHSTTLLLPDATVLSLGGGAPGPLTNLNGEIYTPPYLFDENGELAQRPEIFEAPEHLAQGEDFSISVDDPGAISRLTLVKFGAVTHSLNPESRKIDLPFTLGSDGKLNVDLLDNANVVTPGYWMLFAFNDKGTPSVASTVHIGTGGEMFSASAKSFMTLNGSASYNAENDTFLLTPVSKHEAAGVMSNERICLCEDFTISFDVFLGRKDKGGEGIAFVLHNDPYGGDAVGKAGTALGAYGISNGIGIEFDTRWNGPHKGDNKKDHTHFFDTDAGVKLSKIKTLANIENKKWHSVTVHWDAETQTLTYSFDGKKKGALSGDLAAAYLGGEDYAYFGFTGATTRAANVQKVKITSVDAVFEDDSHDHPVTDHVTAHSDITSHDMHM